MSRYEIIDRGEWLEESNFRSALEPDRRPEPLIEPFRFEPLGDIVVRVVELALAAHKLGSSCESPIEEQLGAAILVEFESAGHPLKICTTLEVSANKDDLLLVPQYRWGIYRSDWAILKPEKGAQALLIEADGKAWHSSAEQQAHDAKKDRAAHERGHLTMRFTGSEIYKNAKNCAKQIHQAVFGE